METEEFLSELKNGRKDFSNENLAMVELNGASLVGVNLRGANLRGACLDAANLQGANLRETCLVVADLEGACMEGACLEAEGIHPKTCASVASPREQNHGSQSTIQACIKFDTLYSKRETIKSNTHFRHAKSSQDTHLPHKGTGGPAV